MNNRRILVIDDEISIQESLKGILEDEGFSALSVSSAEEGMLLIEEKKVDLVLLDIWLGDNMDGLTALEEIKKIDDIPIIMISGHASIETAVKATRKGAYDFIEKPLSYDKVILSITNGLRFAQLERENRLLRQSTTKKTRITGNSAIISALRDQIKMVAPTDAWVLIRGEHGTGKELVAQAIHSLSASCDRPMVEVNCAAIPEELIESELFGHEKGSFTGANANKRGKFDQADGGILFLDEIGDMSLKTQAKTLRILQEQKFERVGGSKTIHVNVRVLAATNKNLEDEIQNGNFRPDLFYRLNVVPIHVPLLRDRIEDIPLLVDDLMDSLNGKGLVKKVFDKSAYREMMKHDWPGNVRELQNFIERLAIMCPDGIIHDHHIQFFLKSPTGNITGVINNDMRFPYQAVDFKEAKRSFEREYLNIKLEENEGNISKTAEQIGLERSHLHKKLKSLNIIQ
ncbi:sigma-54-dependent transcriptional regulator [Desulfopila inferna]|mgnify:CR=1 FL=1|uniref:sigma-54-dependent transcriptional regulator n=1 Tax=Desulfopila inferna TaxID=468528 RepID=UPI0019655E15|nr:sigma-54 dependent transcriptional regulator [Desulfopila inferna]MBM9604332.1 sigma-54-dependent Fis family transcriptional regulator [Desulfopila inferna]